MKKNTFVRTGEKKYSENLIMIIIHSKSILCERINVGRQLCLKFVLKKYIYISSPFEILSLKVIK